MDTAQTWTMIGGFLGLFTVGVAVLGHALRSVRDELVARIDAVSGLLDAHQKQTAAGFAALTARFDQSDARADTFDHKLDALDQRTTSRFDALDQRLTARFDQSDARIDALTTGQYELAGRISTLEGSVTDVRAILQPIADELLRAGITGRKPGA